MSAVNPAAGIPTIRTRDLAVGYQSRHARQAVLEGVNLSVHPGQLVCLLGPNGIGKSTLIRTLARLQPPLAGSIELTGTNLTRFSASNLACQVGVVLTDPVHVGSFSARAVVELGRYPRSGWLGKLTDRDREIVDWALSAAGAAQVATREFGRLSDGERQRVMIARALAQEPRLLVLDEPTAFLDAASRVELIGLLRQLTRENCLAVVLSTHDLELALRAADIVWLAMPGGELVTGAPEDVVMSGAIARAFEGRQLKFDALDRSFRWRGGDRGEAHIIGAGLRAEMATSVLEREGFVVNGNADVGGGALRVRVTDHLWTVESTDPGDEPVQGSDFAALADHLRARHREAPTPQPFKT